MRHWIAHPVYWVPVAFLSICNPPGQARGGQLTSIAWFNGTDGSSPVSGLTIDAGGNLYGTTWYANGGGLFSTGNVFEVANGTDTITNIAYFNGDGTPSGVTLDPQGNIYGSYDNGIYEIAKGTNTITTLSSLTGIGPNGVALDAQGNIYTTGGPGYGSVLELVKGGSTFTTLATFGASNGYATSAVTLDSQGNIYGTTYQGGASGAGTVWQLVKGSSSITTLASFNAATGSPGTIGLGQLTIDSNGNVYGTTASGGAYGYGMVFEVAHGSSTITPLASFTGTNPFFDASIAVTVDAQGNLFGTTSSGGPTDDGTLFEIIKGSDTLTTLATFDASTTGAVPYGSVVIGANGNIYGTCVVGGDADGDGTVWEYSSAVPEPSSFVTCLIGLCVMGGFVVMRRGR